MADQNDKKTEPVNAPIPQDGEAILGRLENVLLEHSRNDSDDVIKALRDIAGMKDDE